MGAYGVKYARPLDDNMCFQMALDLISREQKTIGINSAKFRMADYELKTVGKGSRDLPKIRNSRAPIRVVSNL